MADTNIRFKLSSAFEGDGFNACTQALNQNKKEITASIRGLGDLTNAFKAVSPEATAAVNVVKQFGNAFVQGGIVGGAITLALKGLAEGVKFVAEKMAEAKQATKDYYEILKNKLLVAIGDSSAAFKGLRDQMGGVAQEANDLLAVLNGQAAHEAANEIFQVNVQRLNDLSNAMSDTEKEIVNAAANYKIALIKAEEKETEAANAVDAYKTKLEAAASVKEAAANRVAETDQALADLNEECKGYLSARAQVENFLATEEERFKEGTIDLKQILIDRKDVALKLKELEETYADDVKKMSEAEAAAKTAKDDAAAAARAYETAQNALNAAINKHEEATNEVALAEKEGQQKMQEANDKAVAAKEELAQKEQEAKERWTSFLANQVQKLEDATDGLADTMNYSSSSLDEWLNGIETEGGGDGEGEGEGKAKKVKVVNPAQIGNAVGVNVAVNGVNAEIKKPRKLENEVFERIKNGTASIADWKRFDRFQQREERDAQSSRHRMGADAVRFIQNADKPKSWLSARDVQFQADFKQRVLATLPKDVAADLLQGAAKHVLVKNDLKEFLGDRGSIIQYLEKLGLK